MDILEVLETTKLSYLGKLHSLITLKTPIVVKLFSILNIIAKVLLQILIYCGGPGSCLPVNTMCSKEQTNCFSFKYNRLVLHLTRKLRVFYKSVEAICCKAALALLKFTNDILITIFNLNY